MEVGRRSDLKAFNLGQPNQVKRLAVIFFKKKLFFILKFKLVWLG